MNKIILLLVVAIAMQPIIVSAYGGGLPPVIAPGPNIGPNLELIRERLSARWQQIEERLQSIFERLSSTLLRWPFAAG